MIVITRDQVKLYSGIEPSDTTYDDQIDRYIPIIDAKVKQITGNRFNSFYQVSQDSTEYLEVYDFQGEALDIGAQITGQGIAADSYIQEVYYEPGQMPFALEVGSKNYSFPVIKLNNAATQTDANAQVFVGINIAYHPEIAKGIFWLIGRENTTSLPGKSIKSRSMGPLSVSYDGTDAKIDGRYGMPAGFVKAFPKYHRGF